MKNIIGLTLILLSLICKGQDNSETAQIKGDAGEIFNKLIESIGNFSLQEPRLEIVNIKHSVARYVPGDNVVFFEVEAYKLCKELAGDHYKDAIAFILAHELGHRYKEHGWIKKFGSAYADMDVWNEIVKGGTSPEQIKRDETQADLFAGFFCHASGYDALRLVPALLDSIYSRYHIPAQSDRYPSLNERKEISQKTLETLKSLIPVFDVANLSLVIGDQDIAIQCYEHILKSNFSSREIFNNIGIAYCQKALVYFEPQELKYVYPFEFDAETRLETSTRSVSEEEERLRNELLQTALKYFKKSVSLDEHYSPPYLNIACVSEILGDENERDYHFKKYQNIHPDSNATKINTLLLQGIMEANEGNLKNAENNFGDAICKDNYVAEVNLKILKGMSLKKNEMPAAEILPAFDNVHLEKLSVETMKGQIDTIRLDNVIIYKAELPNSEIYVVYYKNRRQHFIQVSKAENTVPLVTGININEGSHKITSMFGKPEKLVASTKDYYYSYNSGKLIFKVSAEHKIKGWILVFSLN